MKKGNITVLLSSCILCSGCAYLAHRGRDLTDVVTVAVEDHTVGFSARVMFPWGLCIAEGSGWGLRDGHIGAYDYMDRLFAIPLPVPGALYDIDFSPESDYRDKGYTLQTIKQHPPYDMSDYQVSQFFSVQVSAGLYYGLRLGLNLAEALDFILGWTTLDILQDDVERPTSSHSRDDRVGGNALDE